MHGQVYTEGLLTCSLCPAPPHEDTRGASGLRRRALVCCSGVRLVGRSAGKDSRCGGLSFTLDVCDEKGEVEALPLGSAPPQKPSLLSPASAEPPFPWKRFHRRSNTGPLRFSSHLKSQT